MKKLRIKFLVLQLERGIDDIAQSFNNNQYTEKKGVGIISGTLDGSSISSTFVEKKKIYEEISYPNGNTETQERFKYIYIDFKVRLIEKKFFLFQLINSPLSIRPLVLFLSKLNPDLIVEKYKFDLPKFHKCLKQYPAIEKIRVTSLNASSLPFSEKSAAKIELFSEADSFSELKKVYGEKGYRLDRLVFTISIGGVESELSASSSGTISFTDTLDEKIVVSSFVKALEF